MSIMNCYLNQPSSLQVASTEMNGRYDRNILGDLKHGLDLIFKLKKEIDALHPVASETLIQLLSR